MVLAGIWFLKHAILGPGWSLLRTCMIVRGLEGKTVVGKLADSVTLSQGEGGMIGKDCISCIGLRAAKVQFGIWFEPEPNLN